MSEYSEILWMIWETIRVNFENTSLYDYIERDLEGILECWKEENIFYEFSGKIIKMKNNEDFFSIYSEINKQPKFKGEISGFKGNVQL